MWVARQKRARFRWPSLRSPSWALFALLLLGGCSSSVDLTFLSPQGPIAAAQRWHLIIVALILMIVILPVLVLTPIFAWRYRYHNASAPYTPRWSFSWPLEIVIWGIPSGIAVMLAVWLVSDTQGLDPYDPLPSVEPPLRVDIVGYDWKWLFIYPDLGIASLGQFALPAGQPIAIKLTSSTVLQSFFIPALGSQIYAMAGMVTQLHLQANAPRSFLGENTQFNGEGFYQQRFTATAMTPADFTAWTENVKANGIPLTAATYNVIRQRSTLEQTRKALNADRMPAGVLWFSGVSPNLFANVAQSFHGGALDDAALSSGPAELPKSE